MGSTRSRSREGGEPQQGVCYRAGDEIGASNLEEEKQRRSATSFLLPWPVWSGAAQGMVAGVGGWDTRMRGRKERWRKRSVGD